MEGLYRFAASFSGIRFRWDDDVIDRLHHVWTGILLVIFVLVVSSKQYVGDPIECWVPGHLSPRLKYINQVCWITNTYWLPFSKKTIPEDVMEREDLEIGYYQWVPFVLLLQALLFWLPCMFWRTFSESSGLLHFIYDIIALDPVHVYTCISLRSIVQAAVDGRNLDPENRTKTVKYVSRHLQLCLESQREYRSGWFVHLRHVLAKAYVYFGRRYGNYLISIYFISKVLYILNAQAQLLILNSFLGSGYELYGINVLRSIGRLDKAWLSNGKFPRINMCDFVIRVMGNQHRHTVQCVLPVNLFNEKIYMFLWFWFVVLSILTYLNLFKWIWYMAVPRNRRRYVKKHLKLMEAIEKDDRGAFYKFVDQYLRMDGVFVLRLVASNAGDMTASEIVLAMWNGFKSKKKPMLLNGFHGFKNGRLNHLPMTPTCPPIPDVYPHPEKYRGGDLTISGTPPSGSSSPRGGDGSESDKLLRQSNADTLEKRHLCDK